MKKILIRKALKIDAKRISYLIRKNTENVQENKYTDKQIKIWKAANTPGAIANNLNNRTVFCAFQNNKLIGTIGLQENEVVGFYVSYSKRNCGIGQKLLNYIIAYARANKISKLKLTSTPSAITFYSKNGFIKKKNVLINIKGVDFQEMEMIKNII